MSEQDSSKRATLKINPDAKKSGTAARKAARQRTGPRARRLEQSAYEHGQGKISARTLARTGVSLDKLKEDKNLSYRLSKTGMTEQRLAKQAAEKDATRPQRSRPNVPSEAWNPRNRDNDRPDSSERRDRFDARGGEGRGPRPESGERRDRYERRDDSRRDTR
ncbi:MAG: RNA methyltransferase, partial [Alcaligenaceae bacterium]|nr:RNA methyltransferase [Alcaligenaceae bacterium]